MKNCIPVKNPLVRNGTSQRDRLIKALVPDQAPIDDRSVEEIINFLFRYGQQVNYYNLDNEQEGDWQCFFEFDRSIALAVIIALDAELIQRNYGNLEQKLYADRMRYDDEEDESCMENPDPANYQALIDAIVKLAKDIQNICRNIPQQQAIKQEVKKIIYEDLVKAVIDNIVQSALEKLIAFDKGLGQSNDYSSFIAKENEDSCAATWCLTPIGFDCIEYDDLYDVEALNDLFQIFYKAFLKVQQRAKYYFDLYLQDQQNHPPHITMFLTFLHLFQHLQKDLNDLTAKHLQYYYETVLCLKRKQAVPDQVHVIFELAKNFNQERIEAGTGLHAQKDDTGNDRIYKLVEEIVVNQAQVAEIKTTYLHFQRESNDSFTNFSRIFAAPTAKTADGIAAEFDNEAAIRWSALGGLKHSPEYDSPKAEVGFAISSPILLLNEGERIITVKLTLDGNLGTFPQYNPFQLFLSSAEEGFVEIPHQVVIDADGNKAVPFTNTDLLATDILGDVEWVDPTFQQKAFDFQVSDNTINFLIVLTPADLPVVAFDEKTENVPLKAKWPTLKITLNHEAEFINQEVSRKIYPYSFLRDQKLQKVDIDVAAKDIRNLVLENDKAQLDPNKQVLPFSTRPKVNGHIGSNFYIGSDEIFRKKVKQLNLNVEWADLPSNFATHYNVYNQALSPSPSINNGSFLYNLYKLENRSFQKLDTESNKPLFGQVETQIDDAILERYGFERIVNVVLGNPAKKSKKVKAAVNPPGGVNEEAAALLVNWGIITEENKTNEALITAIYDDLKKDNTHLLLAGLEAQKVDLNINLGADAAVDSIARRVQDDIRRKLKKKIVVTGVSDNAETTVLDTTVYTIEINNVHETASPYLPTIERYEKASQQRGFLRMELAGQDFLHDEYNDVLTTQSIAKSKDGQESTELPNEPYTPTINSISADYLSCHTITMSQAQMEEQFFHITPFGYRELAQDFCLVPQYNRPVSSINPNPKTNRPLSIRKEIEQPRPTIPIEELPRPTIPVEELPRPTIPVEEIPTGENPRPIIPIEELPRPTIPVEELPSPVFPIGEIPEVAELPTGERPISVVRPVTGISPGLSVRSNRLSLNQDRNVVINLADGNLYIGLENLKPKQTLSLLFQVLEGSGNNELNPPNIEWSYLVDNDWTTFLPFEILMDTTKSNPDSKKSLLRSGIVRLAIPKDISNAKTTILNPAYHWVRASTIVDLEEKTSPAALPDLVNIQAQAALAQFEDQDNSLIHLKTALDPKTISQLTRRVIPIKSVAQPYASFSGQFPESDNDFYRRISERLRHKDRAITVWDYERLTLEKFPEIYKAKCINHTDYDAASEILPGSVSIAVIPNLANKNTFNPAEPRVPIGVRDAIEVYLRTKTNFFIACEDQLEVVNPLYEELQVRTCLKFKDGLDQEFYRYQLNRDLKAYLAPWAFDDTAEITFGGDLHTSLILNFIEEKDYVDVVMEFNIRHFDNEGCEVYNSTEKENNTDLVTERIVPTTSRSIFTTFNRIVAANDYEHDIIALNAEQVAAICNPPVIEEPFYGN